jgi:MFS family permease
VTEPAHVTTPTHARKTLAFLTLASMTGEYSVLILPFILAAMMQAFGFSEATAGRLISVQLLAMTCGSTLVSFLLRPGRPLWLLFAVGAGSIALANATCAILHAPAVITGARALTGLGEGAIMATAGAAVCATPDPHRAFSVIAMAAAVAAIGALVMTPALTTHAGPQGLFWFLAAAPLVLISVIGWTPSALAPTAKRPSWVGSELLHGAPLLFACLAFWCGSSGLWVYAERIGTYQGLSSQQIGFWLSLGQMGGLAGPLFCAWAVPRIGTRVAIVIGCLGMVAATISFIFGGHPWTYGLGGLLASFWLMFVSPCLRSRMASLDPSGRTVALSTGFYTVGFALAPLLVSWVTVEGRGYTNTGALCLTCFIASSVLGSMQKTD